jgi:hypothetical protein
MRVVAALLPGVVVLGGCAAPGPTPRPGDYPVHVSSPPLNLHFRLTVEPGAARVAGLVERQTDRGAVATVQLIGVDGGGRIVSFSQPLAVRWSGPWDTVSFAMALTPKGGEQRYDVRVQSFQYRLGMNSNR